MTGSFYFPMQHVWRVLSDFSALCCFQPLHALLQGISVTVTLLRASECLEPDTWKSGCPLDTEIRFIICRNPQESLFLLFPVYNPGSSFHHFYLESSLHSHLSALLETPRKFQMETCGEPVRPPKVI